MGLSAVNGRVRGQCAGHWQKCDLAQWARSENRRDFTNLRCWYCRQADVVGLATKAPGEVEMEVYQEPGAWEDWMAHPQGLGVTSG